MTELSRITGAASGTIFHHFKNKEDLFLTILNETRNDIESALDQHKKTSSYDCGMDMVEGMVAFYLNLSGSLEDQFLLLHRHFPYQMAETNAICRSYLESVYTCLLDAFESAISDGIEDGSIKSRSPRNTAMVLFAMIDGVARMNTYKLYHAGSLYQDISTSCRRLLSAEDN